MGFVSSLPFYISHWPLLQFNDIVHAASQQYRYYTAWSLLLFLVKLIYSTW